MISELILRIKQISYNLVIFCCKCTLKKYLFNNLQAKAQTRSQRL